MELPPERIVPGPRGRELLDRASRVEPACASDQVPVVWDRGEGVWITDVDDNRYIDFTSGVLVVNVGHSHPRAVAAVAEQAERLGNTYSFLTPERVELAERIVASLPGNLDRIFMLTTGSEATEAALRMARRATGKQEVVSFSGGFHGRTYGAMSVAGLSGVRKGFGSLVPGTIHAPYPYCYRCPLELEHPSCGMACIEEIDKVVAAESTGDLGTVMVEPYQGAAGFLFPPDGWLTALESWAADRNLLLIVDEVQASFGRTGRRYAIEWEDVHPQLLCLGKGFGSILPVSGVAGEAWVFETMEEGELSSTWGGNPLASAAAMAVFEILDEEQLDANAERVGAELKQELEAVAERIPCVGDVRGKGLVLGVELVDPEDKWTPAPELAGRVVRRAAELGLLLGKLGMFGNVIRVAPPLVITEEEARVGVAILERALADVQDAG